MICLLLKQVELFHCKNEECPNFALLQVGWYKGDEK